METFTLTTSTGSAVFNGTDVVITASTGEATTYSVQSDIAPTVVNVTEGEELQINETDAAPEATS